MLAFNWTTDTSIMVGRVLGCFLVDWARVDIPSFFSV